MGVALRRHAGGHPRRRPASGGVGGERPAHHHALLLRQRPRAFRLRRVPLDLRQSLGRLLRVAPDYFQPLSAWRWARSGDGRGWPRADLRRPRAARRLGMRPGALGLYRHLVGLDSASQVAGPGHVLLGRGLLAISGIASRSGSGPALLFMEGTGSSSTRSTSSGSIRSTAGGSSTSAGTWSSRPRPSTTRSSSGRSSASSGSDSGGRGAGGADVLSHPFTGIELVGVLGRWSAIEILFVGSEACPRWFPLACLVLAAGHLGYYLVFLNQFRVAPEALGPVDAGLGDRRDPLRAGLCPGRRVRGLGAPAAPDGPGGPRPAEEPAVPGLVPGGLRDGQPRVRGPSPGPADPLHPGVRLDPPVPPRRSRRSSPCSTGCPAPRRPLRLASPGRSSALFLTDNALWFAYFPIRAALGKPTDDIYMSRDERSGDGGLDRLGGAGAGG